MQSLETHLELRKIRGPIIVFIGLLTKITSPSLDIATTKSDRAHPLGYEKHLKAIKCVRYERKNRILTSKPSFKHFG
jgi:hypothetical protein